RPPRVLRSFPTRRSSDLLREPLLELAVEIAARIALAARIDRAGAMPGQLLVDQARHRLIGRRPIAVAAAEHRITHLGESVLRQVDRKSTRLNSSHVKSSY